MNEDDFDLFKAEVANVEPLNTPPRVALKSQNDSAPSLQARREAAVGETSGVQSAPLSTENVPSVDPLAILSFVRPGVQQGVFKKLRLGKYQIDARLDLHRMSVEQARNAVLGFIRDCVDHDVRCALIAHGKGVGRSQPAMLKSCIAAWLPELPQTLAFHSAQAHHGGSGATYVLVRKSEKKRQSNWERHIGRRG